MEYSEIIEERKLQESGTVTQPSSIADRVQRHNYSMRQQLYFHQGSFLDFVIHIPRILPEDPPNGYIMLKKNDELLLLDADTYFVKRRTKY
jgi:hypothetical protein